MNIEQIYINQNLYKKALDLRYELFFKEFDLPKEIVKDDLEGFSNHFCISSDGDLLAYGRLTDLGAGNFKISQVVVPPSMQRQGYGKTLLQGIVSLAKDLGAETIELNSQLKAKSLYEGLGFKQSGDRYPSKTTGILHVKMVFGSGHITN